MGVRESKKERKGDRKKGLGGKVWIRADMGPREIGVLFLYLGESRQEGAFLLADLAGSKNRGKSVENLPG